MDLSKRGGGTLLWIFPNEREREGEGGGGGGG